jgi:hypothetical protein
MKGGVLLNKQNKQFEGQPLVPLSTMRWGW